MTLRLANLATMKMAKQKDLIFDVGMHRGEDTDFYLRKGFRVIGFEADPALAAHCRWRFKDEVRTGQLTLVEGAIARARAAKDVKFYRNRCCSVWGTVHKDWARRNESLGAASESIEVKPIDFAECLERYGIPHYLKIDIEGSDILCLRALLGFEQKPDYVSIESEKFSFRKLKEEFRLLERLGYGSFKIVQQKTIPGMRTKIRGSEYVFENAASGLFGEDLPGKWKNQQQALAQYRGIFLLYHLYGDYGILNSYRLGRGSRKALQSIFRAPIPGWYDTHAKLLSYEPRREYAAGRPFTIRDSVPLS
jgi:FkbM family methyltransferase